MNKNAIPKNDFSVVDTSQFKKDSHVVNPKTILDSLTKLRTTESQSEDSLSQEENDSLKSISKIILPFEIKSPTKKEIHRFQTLIQQGVVAFNKKNYRKARLAFIKAQPTEKLAQVYKTILLAQAYRGENDFVHSDSVLQATLNWVGGRVWQNYLLNLRIEIFPRTQPNDSIRLNFISLVSGLSISEKVKINFLYEQLRLEGFTGLIVGFEKQIKILSQIAPADKRLDSLYQVLRPHYLPGQADAEVQNWMLEIESKLGNYASAMSRCNALLKAAKTQEEKQALEWTFTNLIYQSKNYTLAISAAKKHIENFGESADAVLLIARSYDKLKDSTNASIYYDQFLEKFPRHEKSSEICWLRAWEFEAQGKYKEATEYYLRELSDFNNNKRGDWSNFRIGLCNLKAGNASAAATSFHSIRLQNNSNAYSAGLYWEAKALQETGDSAAAGEVLIELVQKYPFQFYGHLGRDMLDKLEIWDDSLEVKAIKAVTKSNQFRPWMKLEWPNYSQRLENKDQSEYLNIKKLLQFKLDTLAILTLKTIPNKIKTNPWFLYTYAQLFQKSELWNESYKLGLQLTQKIAPDKWGSAPKEILTLIFPKPFESIVQNYAKKNQLDPAFVYALMRQESGFDHEIKSAAGAIGLMQLMPATGKIIAKEESLGHFEAAMLMDPEVNIDLGTAYLRDLKKEYHDNPYLVLANYNAGPEATKRWQKAGVDKPIEAMVEDISYWETRDYVKKVMGNYATYRLFKANRVKPPEKHQQK